MIPTSFFVCFFLRLLPLLGHASLIGAVPQYGQQAVAQAAPGYWLSNIQRQGNVAYGGSPDYKIFRNVKDFGAKGDGTTDDTAAINTAISSGNRCGQGCNSSTTTPALVYFPSGTYSVSKPIIQYYYTQLVGDAGELPTLKASSAFSGMAVIDSDPYDDSGNNWFTNQNNFYRQVRNFVIDLTAMPPSSGAGIHWQVAQATSLQNIVFNMVKGGGDGNKQQGIFMDNGSGGFMSDLVFNGGNYGAFFGNQQFTTRNLTFNGCNTAVFMNWNWLWSLKSLSINDCQIGIDMATAPTNQTVGSVIFADSILTNTKVGVRTAFTQSSVPTTGGTLVIDNVDFTGCPVAVENAANSTILAGGNKVASWVQGKKYEGASGSRVQGNQPASLKPKSLLDESGKVFERSKPQYDDVPSSNFVSVKSKGAKGDGITDDTQAIVAALNGLRQGQILYFDHGAYVVSDTVRIPKDAKITGEIWPTIMAKGEAFQDQNILTPVFQVGQPGDIGSVEITDLVFETVGPQLGAKLIEWNLAGSSPGAAGMWDVHARVGGSAGTKLQADTCTKNPAQIAPANPTCGGAGMLAHFTKTASAYLENTWFWVADHELDIAPNNQINIFNGRGVLIESTQALWMYGTASEHSVLYNYQLNKAQNVYMSVIQTETPYFQSNPDATTPFVVQTAINDPNYGDCDGESCKKAWGVNIQSSSDVLIYGAGLYSFFDNWNQECASSNNCQENMINIQDSSSGVAIYGLSTKAAVNMATVNGKGVAQDMDNRSNFCATLALLTPE